MIDLMAESSCQQLCSFNFKGLHLFIISSDLYIIRSCYHAGLARQGKAAFIAGLFSACLDNNRIDQQDRILSCYVNDYDPLQDSHLRRCQSDSVCIIHGLKHVFDQLRDSFRYLCDRLTGLVQNRITHFPDISDCHSSPSLLSSICVYRVKIKLYKCAVSRQIFSVVFCQLLIDQQFLIILFLTVYHKTIYIIYFGDCSFRRSDNRTI